MIDSANSSNLSTRTLLATQEVFESLGWRVGQGAKEIDRRFELFCELLARLVDDEERELLIELTKDFFHLSFNEYPIAVEDALRKLEPLLPSKGAVIAAPLIAPKDIGKTKSGAMAAYLFRPMLADVTSQHGLRFQGNDRPEIRPFKLKGGIEASPFRPQIILIDDFLGSGQTAKDAIKAFQATYKVPASDIVVLALVGQKGAVDTVTSLGATAIVTHVRVRGISDSARLKNIPRAIEVMLGIEGRLKVSPEYQLGFMQSEALVCMYRCPNNTFPVYWTDKKVNKLAWPAPFKR